MTQRTESLQFGTVAASMLQRYRSSPPLGPFDIGAIREIVLEMGGLYSKLKETLEIINSNSGPEPQNVKQKKHGPLVCYFDGAIRRNKRCVLAYLSSRLSDLTELFWCVSSSMSEDAVSSSLAQVCHPQELAFYTRYKQFISEFQNAQLSESVSQSPHQARLKQLLRLDCDHYPPNHADVGFMTVCPTVQVTDSRFGNPQGVSDHSVTSNRGEVFHIRKQIGEGLVVTGFADHLIAGV